MITLTCPNCNGKLSVKEEDINRNMRCCYCEYVFRAHDDTIAEVLDPGQMTIEDLRASLYYHDEYLERAIRNQKNVSVEEKTKQLQAFWEMRDRQEKEGREVTREANEVACLFQRGQTVRQPLISDDAKNAAMGIAGCLGISAIQMFLAAIPIALAIIIASSILNSCN